MAEHAPTPRHLPQQQIVPVSVRHDVRDAGCATQDVLNGNTMGRLGAAKAPGHTGSVSVSAASFLAQNTAGDTVVTPGGEDE